MKIELVVNSIEDNNYTLSDMHGKSYKLCMYLQIKIDKDDLLVINDKLLKEKTLYFGNLDEKSGRNITSLDDEDLIIIRKDKDYYQKRLYG